LALTAYYLADKSALARLSMPSVGARVVPLIEEGLVATCAIVDLEVLYSTRTPAVYEEVLEERRALDAAPVTQEVMEIAIEFQRALARRGQHRIPIPDLIISASAHLANLVVLHYDEDFARIHEVGGAAHEWVVPRGTV
jgi:hypothetical protein